jgi:hypothetical protein
MTFTVADPDGGDAFPLKQGVPVLFDTSLDAALTIYLPNLVGPVLTGAADAMHVGWFLAVRHQGPADGSDGPDAVLATQSMTRPALTAKNFWLV